MQLAHHIFPCFTVVNTATNLGLFDIAPSAEFCWKTSAAFRKLNIILSHLAVNTLLVYYKYQPGYDV